MIYINQRRKALRRWFLISEFSLSAASPSLGIGGVRNYRVIALSSTQIIVRLLLYRQDLADTHPDGRLLRYASHLAEARFCKILMLLQVAVVAADMMQ